MIAWASQWHCEEVQPYYYDVLNRTGDDDLPAAVVAHVQSCGYCQGKIEELSQLLEQATASDESEATQENPWLRMIQLHFQLAGQDVHCYHVKPFLPVLLHPDYPIRIATPVMEHLCECTACQQDLQRIKALALRPDQLRQLSHFYGDLRSEVLPGPHLIQAQLQEFVQGDLTALDDLEKKHLYLCQSCGDRLDRIFDDCAFGDEQGCSDCDNRTMADFFDFGFCYPYTPEVLSVTPGSSKQGCPLTCSTARSRVRELYRSIFYIAHRHDSGVVTHFDLERADFLGASFLDRLSTPELESCPSSPVGAGQPSRLWERFRPMAIAAVALLICGLVFVQSNGTAEADLSASVREILSHVDNLKIVECMPDQTTTLATLWLSKESQLLASRSRGQTRVIDLHAGTSWDVSMGGQITETALAVEEGRHLQENQLATAWGILPALQAIPSESQWRQRLDNHSNVPLTSTYELTLEGQFGGQLLWVIEVERQNQRPVRIEKYYRNEADDDFLADRIVELYYGTTEEMTAEIRGLISH